MAQLYLVRPMKLAIQHRLIVDDTFWDFGRPILLLLGTALIYVGFLISFTGPDFALTAQPVYVLVLSAFTLLAALVIGLLTRWGAIPRLWHHTPLGVSVALLTITLGWIAIIASVTAAQRATVANAMLGLTGLLAIDFGILHWPNPKGLTKRSS